MHVFAVATYKMASFSRLRKDKFLLCFLKTWVLLWWFSKGEGCIVTFHALIKSVQNDINIIRDWRQSNRCVNMRCDDVCNGSFSPNEAHVVTGKIIKRARRFVMGRTTSKPFLLLTLFVVDPRKDFVTLFYFCPNRCIVKSTIVMRAGYSMVGQEKEQDPQSWVVTRCGRGSVDVL